MDTIAIVTALETRAKRAGLTMGKACAAAGIAQSTITRWKSRTHEPNVRHLRKLDEVITAAERREAEAEMAATPLDRVLSAQA